MRDFKSIALDITRVVASADTDPWGEEGDVLLTRAQFDLLREAHADLHALSRGDPYIGPDLSLMTIHKAALKAALRRTGGHYTKAARLLGIDKSTLYRWRREYGLD